MRSVWLFCTWLCLAYATPAAPAPAQAGEYWLSLSVAGKAEGQGAYTLRLTFHPVASFPVHAVLVYAEPSHRLLAVIQDAKSRPLPEAGEALVAVESELSHTVAPSLRFAFDPQEDRGIAVELRTSQGALLLARAQVSLREFAFSSEYEPQLRKIRHCCSCGSCGRMCEACDDAYFTCDCASCTIRCGW